MQAIQTKYIGPTNHRGARVKASCAAGTKTIPYDHARNVKENHILAARILRFELGWKCELESGCLPDGTWAHVFISKES